MGTESFVEEVETKGQMAWRDGKTGRSQFRVETMQMKEQRDGERRMQRSQYGGERVNRRKQQEIMLERCRRERVMRK